MTAYVVGLAFDDDENVALIRKERPEWQKGFLNGVGGKIKEGESSLAAMVREFEEETGWGLPESEWELFVTLQGSSEQEKGDWSVAFFRAVNVDLKMLRTTTDEEIIIWHARHLPPTTLGNLQWIIPLALDLRPRIPNLVIYD